ncbi:hypothetical protein QUB11_03740 [Microcoleus sp. B6-A1]|uniref:hypothetical protein n=1 Tax=Microcoleus sp. B6-A1 TaxID=2818684 RepID=UPI002FD43378
MNTTIELPEIAENGFILVTDFFAYQHESIATAMTNSGIPHEIKFHPFDPDALWKQGAFRVYVAPEHLKIATDLCMSIEFGSK